MLGDELLFGSLPRQSRLAVRGQADAIPPSRSLPRVFYAGAAVGLEVDAMRHRQRNVVLVVDRARDRRHGATRHDLTDEHHAAPYLASLLTANVQAKVHLVEVAVERDGSSQDLGTKKAKAHQADIGRTVPEINL